jgi:hypothetical protein
MDCINGVVPAPSDTVEKSLYNQQNFGIFLSIGFVDRLLIQSLPLYHKSKQDRFTEDTIKEPDDHATCFRDTPARTNDKPTKGPHSLLLTLH